MPYHRAKFERFGVIFSHSKDIVGISGQVLCCEYFIKIQFAKTTSTQTENKYVLVC